jgi:hypothetical protein
VYRDSSVVITTRYGLDGPGIDPGGARFSAPVQTGPEAHPASYTIGTRSLPGVQRQRNVDHPPAYSVKVKERVELFLYFPCGPSWSDIGWIWLLRGAPSTYCRGDGAVPPSVRHRLTPPNVVTLPERDWTPTASVHIKRWSNNTTHIIVQCCKRLTIHYIGGDNYGFSPK